ncbi:hypothetical protein CHN44_19985, partial [Vibrio cholerae]
VVVEDNAGLYQPPSEDYDGLGMQIVEKRLTNKFGTKSGLQIEVAPQEYTRMSFVIPQQGTY